MAKKVEVLLLAGLCAGVLMGCGKTSSAQMETSQIESGQAGFDETQRVSPAAKGALEDTGTEVVVPVSEAVVEAGSNTLEIKEKMFLAQIDDIYNNFDLYKDKKVIVEGIYQEFVSADGTQTAPVVFRYGPGCCGNDGWGGFLLHYNGEFPAEDSWIRVSGTPELIKNESGYTDLYLNVETLVVKEERGEEYVMQ